MSIEIWLGSALHGAIMDEDIAHNSLSRLGLGGGAGQQSGSYAKNGGNSLHVDGLERDGI